MSLRHGEHKRENTSSRPAGGTRRRTINSRASRNIHPRPFQQLITQFTRCSVVIFRRLNTPLLNRPVNLVDFLHASGRTTRLYNYRNWFTKMGFSCTKLTTASRPNGKPPEAKQLDRPYHDLKRQIEAKGGIPSVSYWHAQHHRPTETWRGNLDHTKQIICLEGNTLDGAPPESIMVSQIAHGR